MLWLKGTIMMMKFLGSAIGILSLGIMMIPGALAVEWAQRPSWAIQQQQAKLAAARRAPARESSAPIQPFAPETSNLAIDLGQVFLMGDLSEDYSDNLGFRMLYTYGVSDIFGFESSVGYSNHTDGDFSMASMLFGLRTNLAWYDRIIPYASFGLGFYRPSYSFTADGRSPSLIGAPDEGVETVAPILFGIHLSAGMNLQLTQRVFFGTSLTFHDIFGSDNKKPNGEKFAAGGTFTSLLIHAGVTF